jgi:CheY-like chemotaxis protein
MDDCESPLRVLVVDDDAITRETVALLVRMAGHHARTAWDGFSALAIAADYLPEVVFLDVYMPGLDGLQVARRLRSELALRDTYVVCVTGLTDESDVHRSRDAGCDELWVKPFEPERLRELLSVRRSGDQAANDEEFGLSLPGHRARRAPSISR